MRKCLKIEDNIDEILSIIIRFTKIRKKVLNTNVEQMYNAGFEPKDVPTEEFSQSINIAISEHVQSGRLLLFDSENLRFKSNGEFELSLIEDADDRKLFEKDIGLYLDAQSRKLAENQTHKMIAEELMKEKNGVSSELISSWF